MTLIGNYYETLGVAPDATPDQIKAAFRAAAVRQHPDKCPAGTADQVMGSLNRAYTVLRDPSGRQQHDRYLAVLDELKVDVRRRAAALRAERERREYLDEIRSTIRELCSQLGLPYRAKWDVAGEAKLRRVLEICRRRLRRRKLLFFWIH